MSKPVLLEAARFAYAAVWALLAMAVLGTIAYGVGFGGERGFGIFLFGILVAAPLAGLAAVPIIDWWQED